MDYTKIGLKAGIEIHQRLDTKHKLFCQCRPRLSPSQPVMGMERRLRVVAGELGQIDAAAMHEFLSGKKFFYRAYPEESCLVEADEEPPHEMNSEALDMALMVSQMLNCMIPDEIHVMRKQVIDGSNTTGFQRTAVVGLDGFLETKSGRVGISGVCLEEESAQILEKKGSTVIYGLDRLCIPLVEIGTHPDIKSPEHAREVASKLGMILRSGKISQRGIGTIRQDINISIKGGARVEIKGAQELRLIPRYVENEVLRQLNLVEIRDSLKRQGFTGIEPEIHDATKIFRNADSPITKNRKTFAIKLPGLAGFLRKKLTPTRTLGNELANYVRVKSGSRGFIHSDEDLKKYRLEKEFEELKKEIKAGESDCLVIFSGEEGVCRKAIECLVERVNMLVKGVPEETRRALENGDSEYMRPLPGASRMYPETDICPIRITENRLKRISERVSEFRREIEKVKKLGFEEEEVMKIPNRKIFLRFVSEYGISPRHAYSIVLRGSAEQIEFIQRLKKAFPSLKLEKIARVVIDIPKDIETRYGIRTENLRSEHYEKICDCLSRGKITMDAVPEILRKLSKNPDKRIEDFIVKAIPESKLREIIRNVIEKNRDALEKPRPEKILMGEVMKLVRGRAEGATVMKILMEEMKRK